MPYAKTALRVLFAITAALATPLATAADELHIYNWNDYFAEDTLSGFEQQTGIHPVLDVYDANEILEAKLFAGRSGYDLIFPTARPFAARHIKAELYLPLDKSQLDGLERLDSDIMQRLAELDPDNAHVVPYLWGSSGLGLNLPKVRAALGVDESTPLGTWALLFDPEKAAKLATCGISLLDDPVEIFQAGLAYLGRDPNSTAQEDLDAVAELIRGVHQHVRYFHSSQYITDLANGDICIAHGYSGDVLQASERAAEAGKGIELGYRIPREGAPVWIDVMAIPKDAPNPQAALRFIEYLLKPEPIAAVSNYVRYANPNLASTSLLDADLRDDPGIYPDAETRARLFSPTEHSDADIRRMNRLWTRLKANR